MRLISNPGALALVMACASLAACSENIAEIGAGWKCGAVAGVDQIAVASAPSFILVGEFTETSETPAAFAEMACHLARSGRPLYVGVSEYVGGATDAETRMRARLDELVAKGAPIIVGVAGEAREWTPRARTVAEKNWAAAIMAKVQASGAERALILLTRSDALAAPVRGAGERFAGFDPMATHLPEGEVLSLEVVQDEAMRESTVALYPAISAGFHGRLALPRLTRPALKLEGEASLPPSLERWRMAGGAYPPPAPLTQKETAAAFSLQLRNARAMQEAIVIEITKGAVDSETFKPLLEFWDAEILRLEQAIAAEGLGPPSAPAGPPH